MMLLNIIISHIMKINECFTRDKRMAFYPLVGKPWGMCFSIILYLMIVLKFGPRFMKNRKPYKIEGIIRIYNVVQILLNFVIFIEALRYSYWSPDFKWMGQPYDPNDYGPRVMKLVRPSLLFYYSKYLDFFDTIFFLMRKKFNQISFLHVYHHALMVFAVYVYCTFLWGSFFTLTGVINSFVHVVMYSYYLAAALKTKWNLEFWKTNLTRLQLLQFTIFLFYFMAHLQYENTNTPHSATIAMTIQNSFIFALFANFYYKTYILKDKKKTLAQKIKS